MVGRANKKRRRPMPPVGSHVLIGKPGISMPNDWYLGIVLWVDGERELLIEHGDLSGMHRYRQVFDLGYVRAAGTIEELIDFKRRCADRVKGRQNRVHACEAALDRARAAVWGELDKIAEG